MRQTAPTTVPPSGDKTSADNYFNASITTKKTLHISNKLMVWFRFYIGIEP